MNDQVKSANVDELVADELESAAGGDGPSSSYGSGAYGGGQIIGHGIVQGWNAWAGFVGPIGADVIEYFFPIENQTN